MYGDDEHEREKNQIHWLDEQWNEQDDETCQKFVDGIALFLLIIFLMLFIILLING